MTWLLFIIGAMIAGFVQGLTGFAFALVAMSFWIWALPPQLAAPLVVFASVWSHVVSLSQEQKASSIENHVQLSSSLVWPYLIAGLIGVPLGTYLLHFIQTDYFKLTLGLFLLIWCPVMLYLPKIDWLTKPTPWLDRSIGFLGGVFGGLGGFCGALPSAWVTLKHLPKHQQRYILRHFNFAIQIFTLAVYLWQGTLNLNQWFYILLILIFVSIPAILGARLFYKISEHQFKRIVLGLLFASGCFLSVSFFV
jgi:uncharacterized protein